MLPDFHLPVVYVGRGWYSFSGIATWPFLNTTVAIVVLKSPSTFSISHSGITWYTTNVYGKETVWKQNHIHQRIYLVMKILKTNYSVQSQHSTLSWSVCSGQVRIGFFNVLRSIQHGHHIPVEVDTLAWSGQSCVFAFLDMQTFPSALKLVEKSNTELPQDQSDEQMTPSALAVEPKVQN